MLYADVFLFGVAHFPLKVVGGFTIGPNVIPEFKYKYQNITNKHGYLTMVSTNIFSPFNKKQTKFSNAQALTTVSGLTQPAVKEINTVQCKINMMI